jgi:hypothetical protein
VIHYHITTTLLLVVAIQVCKLLSNASNELQQLGLTMQTHWTHAQLQCDESKVTVCLGRNFRFGIALTGAQAVVQSMPGNSNFGTMYQREIPVQTVYELECFIRGEVCRQLLQSLSLVYAEVVAELQQQQHTNGTATTAGTTTTAGTSRVAVHDYSGVIQLWQKAHATAATQNGHSNGTTADAITNSEEACTLAVVIQPVTTATTTTTAAAAATATSGIDIVCSVRRDSTAHKALQHHAHTKDLLLDHTVHNKKVAVHRQQQQQQSDVDQYSLQLHWQQLQGKHVLEQFKTLFSIVLAQPSTS